MRSRFRLSGVCFLTLVMLGSRLMQAQTTLDEALNVPGGGLVFTTSSTGAGSPRYSWTVVTAPEATHDGMAAARSGAVGYHYSTSYSTSILNTTLTGPGVLAFWMKKVGTGDLEFYINNKYSQTFEYTPGQNGEWRFHQLTFQRNDQFTVQWRFKNGDAGSQPGQTENYFLLDEVCWQPPDEQGCMFLLNDDGANYTVWKCIDQAAEVNIPATFAGKPVTVIGKDAFFNNKKLITAVLPEGLLRIEGRAFAYSSLASVTLPSTLQHIGENAFLYCRNLKHAPLPAGLTELGKFAFCSTNLEQVAFPPGLSVIPVSAFQYCLSLRSVLIPVTVQEIGANAFNKCGLTSIVFADRGGKDIPLGAACFAGNYRLYECILPEGITALPANMLAGDAEGVVDLPAIRIPASVTSLGSLAFNYCNNVTIFFMGPPLAVGESGMTSVPDRLGNALVVYQGAHQAAWGGVLDGEGLFHGFRTEPLAGEPIPLPEIATPTDKPTFRDSVAVTFTLQAPLSGDKLLVERSEDNGATFAPTVLTPGESSGGFLAAGAAQWTYTLTASAIFQVHAVRPANGTRGVPGHSRCSGAVARRYLRWNEYADALDNHTLEFDVEDPKYWSVSASQSKVGGSSVFVDLGSREDNPPMHTMLMTQVTGPGVFSFWVYPDRDGISIDFGEVDPTGAGWNGFKEDSLIVSRQLASYFNNPKVWVKCSVAIPEGDFQVGWSFGGGYAGGAAYIDQVQFMKLDGDFGYVVNPDGASVTVMALIDDREPWEEPIPVALEIPATLGGLPVTGIGDYAFVGLALESLAIPPTVTAIGEYAFSRCSGIDEVVVPASVTTLGEGVFADYGDLRHVVFQGAQPADGGSLGGQAAIIFTQGQPGWIDGGAYRGLVTVTISDERTEAPTFLRDDMPAPSPAFMYFNKPFQLIMTGNNGPDLAIRYAVGGAVPTAASPGLLYEDVLELDDATGDITVRARVFRGAAPCSGVTSVTFRNAKELSEVMDCFDAIFVLRDPARWQIIEETDEQGQVINRHLQAGPYPEKARQQAILEFYIHYPKNEVPDKFSLQWRLVSTLANPGSDDAGEWRFFAEEYGTWSYNKHQADWQTWVFDVTKGGWLSGTLTFGDNKASQPGISHLKLDRFVNGAPKATPKVTFEPPGAGTASYSAANEWWPFLGTERMLIGKEAQFRAEASPGYMFTEWQRYDLGAGQYVRHSTNQQTMFQIFADEDGDQAENDFKAVFEPAVWVQVTLSQGGWWPVRYGYSGYSRGEYTEPCLVAKGTVLKFWPEAEDGCVFTGWNDGVTDIDRSVVCEQDIALQANFAKYIRSEPTVKVANSNDAGGIMITCGTGDLTELNPDGTVTYTISVDYPEWYRFAGWEFDQGTVVASQVNGSDLTVTLDWNQTKRFAPKAKFYKQTRITVQTAAGQENCGLLQVRETDGAGEEIILDEDRGAYVDIRSVVWLKGTGLGINRFVRWDWQYGGYSNSSSATEMTETIWDYPSYQFTASFAAQADLTLHVDPDGNGTGKFQVNGRDYQPGRRYDIGTQVTIRAFPDPGNRFVKWLGSDSVYPWCTVYIEPGDNVYTAQFAKTGTVTMKAKVITTGEPGGGVAQVYTPDLGTDLTITATPYYGYSFVKWEDTGSTESSRTIHNVGADNLEFTALYQPVVSVSASAPTGGGSFTGTGQKLLSDFPLTVTAIPNNGYRFVRWLDDPAAPAARLLTVDDIVDSRISLQAMFVRVCHVTVQPQTGQHQLGTVAILDDGGTEFTLDPNTGAYSAVVDAGARISYQATANPGCDFVRWTWDGSKNPMVMDMQIDYSRTFAAVFAQRATINCRVKPGQEAWGAVSMVYEGAPAQSGANFHVGKWIQLTATPQPNARFVRWSDGAFSDVRYFPVAEGEKTYEAEFVRTSSVTVNLTSDTPGEEPSLMRWGFPWTVWLASGQKVVFDVEDDAGKDCLLLFYGQPGWHLPPEQGQTVKVLPQQNLVWDFQYSKITTGTLVGWLNPSNIGAQWRVKANPQTGYPGGGEWLGNGASVVLEQGEYEIEFSQILDEQGLESWYRPSVLVLDQGESATVNVAANQRRNFTGKYRKYIPDLELSFSPGEASEGAGPSATVATLRRLPRIPGGETDRSESITVAFSPSEAGALIFPSSITIPAERERVQFMVGVIDNDVRENTEILAADGETVLGRGRIVRLNGRVSVPSSCNCDGTPSSGAEIFADLAVYDNDGPALQVTVNPSTMQEPLPPDNEKLYPNALTVRRNDRTGDGLPAITVKLWAFVNGVEDDSEFEFRLDGLPVTQVEIPAGELQVTVDIATWDDGVEDGNQLISVYADTDAMPPDEPGVKYTPGSCWVVVSDLSFPDYVVTSVATPAEPLSGGDVYELEVTLKNQGRMPMTGNIPLAVHASANDILNDQNRILETNYVGGLEVGQSASLRLNIPLEMAPGANWRFAVVVNPRSTLREVSLLNNTTWSEKFTVEASYRATVELADPAQATSLMGQPVALAGRTLRLDSDVPIGQVDADVYVIVNGVRRILPVTSDADGRFAIDFTPLPSEAGHVIVGACYPGLGSTDAQDEFDILGLRFVKSVCGQETSTKYVQWGVTMNDVNACSLQLSNRSPVPLSNLRAELVGAPANCEVAWNDDGTDLILGELPGDAMRTVMFTVKGTAPTEDRNYRYFTVRITTDEGAALDIPAYFHAKPRYARLALKPTALDVTMQMDPQSNRGTPRNIEVVISNDGADETGPITVSVPSLTWMKLVGGNTLPSIQPGETTSFLLTLTADGNTPLNAPLNGTLAINAPNAFAGATLPFRATAVAEGTGSLTVDAIDDYTYYEAHAPHLGGALVVVRNPYTNKELARGFTQANGKVTLEKLPVGLCKVVVSKEKHAEKVSNVEIQPGRETTLQVFLDYQAITYSWEVVQVEIEDRYEVELTVTYETNVPMPVVETNMPSKMPFLLPGETYMFSVVLTNKGLIRADDVEFTLPEVFNSPQCAIAFNYPKGTYSLLPQQAVTIPVVATGVAPTRADDDCFSYSLTLWRWECGHDHKWHRVSTLFSVQGTYCGGTGYSFLSGIGGGPVATGPGQATYVKEPPVPTVPSTEPGCRPCTNGLGINLTKCALGALPIIGCGIGIADCLWGLWKAAESGTAYSWTTSGLGCVFNVVGCFHPVGVLASCVLGWQTACEDADNIKNKPQWLADSQEKLKVIVDLLRQRMFYFQEFYGDPCWEAAAPEAVNEFFDAFMPLGLPDGIATLLGDAQKSTLLTVLPEGVEPADLDVFVARWNRSVAYWETCSMDSFPDYPAGANPDDYISLKTLYDLAQEMARCEDDARAMGYESVEDLYRKVTKYMETELKGTSSVCAQVTIKISQTVSLTREAFEGTLTLFNGHENKDMTNVRLQLVVTDAFDKDCTDLFDISELHDRFVELTAIDGAGVLGPKKTGSAVVRFIPENAAAPVTSKTYFFGGILSYTNPFSGETATIELTAVPLEVSPGPRLQMHYFLQRDILGDDPLTEAIEPCYPAELSVLVYNPGYGDAKNFRIDSGQPEITGNDKGLLIDFALWDYDLNESTLNGQPNSAPLGQVNLGTIKAGGHGLAQWWMTASLQGHFIGMSATYTHLTSNGNPDICLIDSVDIHELHRSGQDLEGNTAFLVNDISDPRDTPDTLWIGKDFANGVEPVPVDVYDACTVSGQVFAAGSEDPADPPTYSFTVTPQSGGAWFYVNIPQQVLAGYEIVSTSRGAEDIPFRNCWLTDRTLPDGSDPVYETRLHLFDYFPGTGSHDYVVTLRKKAEVTLEVVSFGGVDGYVVQTALPHIDVFFSDSIRLSTFTAADVTLRRQGQLVGQQDLGNLTFAVVAEDDANKIYQYRIGNLGALTMDDGFYVLTVQAAGITNRQGAAGQVGKQVMWVKSTAAYNGVVIARMEKVVLDGMQEGEYRVDIDFNGAVATASVNRNGLTLTRDGQAVPLGEDVVASASEWPGQFSFAGIDAYTREDGVYRLRFDAAVSGVVDQGGNASAATREITWTVDTTPPGHVDGLRIEVDDGIAADDGVTWGRNKSVIGVLPEGGLKVDILYRMTGGNASTPLTSRQFAAGETAMNIPITLPVDGAITLIVRMTDAAGNSTEDSLNIFIDAIPLTAQFADLPDAPRLLFSAPILDADQIRAGLTLTVNGSAAGVDLSGLVITLVPGSDCEYLLEGLGDCTRVSGAHLLRLNLGVLKKAASGLPGAGTCSAAWKMLYPLTPAEKLALAQAVNSGWTGFDSAGDAYWTVDEQVSADAPDAEPRQSVRSGAVGNGEASVLSLVVPGPGVLRFSWRVSSAAGSDMLAFAINDAVQQTLSGVSDDWEVVETPITGIGDQVLTWTYSRGHVAPAGQNCGWVDLVSYRKYYDVKFTAASRVYDGTTATERTGELVGQGQVGGHEVGVTDANGAYTFATPHQGQGKPVTLTGAELTGADADLYLLRVVNGQADVWPKAIIAGFTANDKVYDGDTATTATDFTFGDQLAAGDKITITGPAGEQAVPATFAQAKVGAWPVAVNLADCVVNGNEHGNYAIDFADNVTATITPRLIRVGFMAEDKVYDGNAVATVRDFVFPGVIPDDALEMAAATAHFAESRVGAWAVTIDDGFAVTGNDDGNYALDFVEVTAQIKARTTEVTFMADDKVYDGARNATVHGFAFANLVGNDALEMAAATASFAESKVGAWAVTIDDGYTVTGNDDGNYAIAFAPVQASITPKAITVGFTADDKEYDGNTAATVRDFVFDGLVAGDAMEVAATANFAEAKVGVWLVTIDDYTVAGNDDGNYAIAFADNVTAAITPKAMTVGFTADDKVYDGTAVATVRDFVFEGIVAGDALEVAATAQFAERKVGIWAVAIEEGFIVTGNDDGNYAIAFADNVTAAITPKAIVVAFTAEDKVYDGTAVATVRDFVFPGVIDGDALEMADATASFAESKVGVWLVTIDDGFTIAGNEAGNYEVNFAGDVKAEIRHNVQVIPVGWSMTVLSLDNLTDESAAAWANLGVMAFKHSTMQIQRGREPGYGESFWVFNRDGKEVALQGLKRFDLPAWMPPNDEGWVMAGPPAEDYVVPEDVLVWAWNGSVFVLIPPGGKLPAGNAAWFWQ